MTKKRPELHYPANIKLANSPLVEAWLTIQWTLELLQPDALIALDPAFSTAFIDFSNSIRNRFGEIKALDTLQIPEQLAPHRPRYQFRKGEDIWPVLQLGPGVATANFVSPYSWKDFRELALYLRPKLLNAYENRQLQTSLISLRYRNAVPCEYSKINILEYLKGYLNINLQLPEFIPGAMSNENRPGTFDLHVSFMLTHPHGRGILRVVTGNKKITDPKTGHVENPEHMIFELEVVSELENAPSLSDEEAYTDWLNSAHSVIHDWFFSLVEGPLMDAYSQKS